ncbi:class II aldolase/adducin family protein [Microbacterium immunditiarum]|uniref:HCOMODA/2-hydroxy-3-carboxy-muconic semialdehyde decarboxylase n=1 Tax=Microbacterium immunditiarum TaxID=337480 RepID=A0A7Y9KLB1_9MICO|nr:class II aldolase/adducin family protein [Microbacterium immunditiarum]NYE21531.1 HCOMODA/2-hydroxy-3-carboxy-muconic semialdehyde decarboxylase [Microbacterium immunditiarum]
MSTSQSELLAQANHILVSQGVLDAFGHVSVRSESDPNRFLLARNMAPALVAASDVQDFDLDGNTGDDRKPYLERYIHSEIYRARPDVLAVVHSHSPAVIPFGVTEAPLRPVFHMAGFLSGGVARFEIADIGGDGTDLLIRDPGLGVALAAALGDAPMALMRGHGSVTVAGSLPLAVYRAIYAEKNAALQRDAISLGTVRYLTEQEGHSAATTNAGQVGRAWDMWLRTAETPHDR